jgi:hypothetical protein
MDQDDLKAIQGLFRKELKTELEPIKEKLDSNTSGIMKVEQKIDAALELRQDVSDVRNQVKHHEERISQLEKI